jgi:hypothetical protein
VPRTHPALGSTPIVSTDYGPVVQRDDASLACWQCGFDSRRVHSIRRVAGYGLPGRFAKPCGRKAVRVQIPCLPLFCPGGETEIMPRS